MTDKITIKNFGPIKHVELDLKEVMVFIGPQASGKSTIAKLIHFFNHVTSDALSKDSEKLWAFFEKLFGELYLFNSPEAEIEYISQNSQITIKNNTIQYKALARQDYKTLLIPAGRAVYSLISDSLFSLTSEAVSIDPIILNFGRHIELSRKRIGNVRKEKGLELVFQEILKGGFKYVNGENRIYFEEDKYITLDRASSGQQEVLPLVLILRDVFYSGKIHFVTVEEPEAHLYPYSQYKLVELISRVHNSHHEKNRFIITTHSPYILSSFNNFLFAYKVAHIGDSAKVIPEQSWINPDQIAAYSVREGRVESIVNESTGLIADNEIDDASEDIAGDFDQLLEIYRESKHG
jgi:AAA15 family ATPase/GTPase